MSQEKVDRYKKEKANREKTMKKETTQQQVTECLNEVLKRFWIVEVSACTDEVGTQQNELWVIPKSSAPTRAAAEKECDELLNSGSFYD